MSGLALHLSSLFGGEGPPVNGDGGGLGRHGGRSNEFFGFLVGGVNRFNVLVDACKEFSCLVASLFEVGRDASHLAPSSMSGDIQIDPGDEAVPGFLVQLDVVVALVEDLDEVTGVGVELHGCEEVVIALGSVSPDEGVQGDVGLRKSGAHGSACDGGIGEVGGRVLSVMASHAVFVESGLDLAEETEASLRPVPVLGLGRGLLHGFGWFDGDGVVLDVMASAAGDVFAGHTNEPASFLLDCLALGIEGLERDGGVGGDLKEGRSIGMDGDGSDQSPNIPGSFDTDGVVSAHVAVGIFILEDSEGLDGSARHPGQALSGVDILNGYDGGLAVQFDLVGNDGGHVSLPQRRRFEEGVAGFFLNEHEIVEDIDEIDAPVCLGSGLARNEEVGVAQGCWMEEFRPGAVHKRVHDLVFDDLAATGDALDGAVVFLSSAGLVKKDQFAHSRDAVVSGDDADELGGAVGDGLGVEDAVGPVAIAAVVLDLTCAIGVHAHEDAAEVVSGVRVLPAEVHDASIMEEGGVPIVILFEGQLSSVFAVGAEEIEVGDMIGAADAGNAEECGG